MSPVITQNRNGDFEKFTSNTKVPVGHLFDNHEFCDESWCYTKELSVRTDEIVKNAA